MLTWAFPAVFREGAPEDWVATFPDLPEAITGGASLAEARLQAADALEEVILEYMARGESIPSPRGAAEGEELVALDPVTASRAALVHAMARRNVTNAGLARRMGRTEGAIRRLVSGVGGVKIDTVLQALATLGSQAALAVTTE